MSDSRPIGVFDSGLGGLTVLKALKEHLTNEQFIYYGDTAHLPYGEKSAETLQVYIRRIFQFMHEQDCKLVVVACNSASTVLASMADLPFPKDRIINVIDPITDLMQAQDRFKHIAVIGTRKTINSECYQQSITSSRPDLELIARMTPLLAPMIEEGFLAEKELFPVFDRYFAGMEGVELIIPACTHYPIIYEAIESYFDQKVKVLHAPKVIAEATAQRLEQLGLQQEASHPADRFHVSDLTESFKREAELFLGRAIELQHTRLTD